MPRLVMPFDSFEIHRCVEVKAQANQCGFVEQVDTDDDLEVLKKQVGGVDLIPFWTLYGRYAPGGERGGLEAIADRETWALAVELLESILGRAVDAREESWLIVPSLAQGEVRLRG